MMKFLLLFVASLAMAIDIVQTPIDFDEKRVELSLDYIKEHYNKTPKDITIEPKIIVIHHTAMDSFSEAFKRLKPSVLPNVRGDIASAGALNVSAHFMVDKDGTIHQLMPLEFMARHTIGLNYNSIGIENVGGESSNDNLTDEQLKANIELVKYLQERFSSIEYMVGHYEYRCFEKTPLWLEVDDGYRTIKNDPSPRFMQELRKEIKTLKIAPCDK
ncbi:MAG: peptidoglycan recognition family protein [Sulfurimonadaceae bacterium]|jgi:beta-N-acetylhexosaminidase|nr:peptidoglycan recognition family protein [Sulfurimonadaceae bacterium]